MSAFNLTVIFILASELLKAMRQRNHRPFWFPICWNKKSKLF